MKTYLTLWHYSTYAGRWIVLSETDTNPIIVDYDKTTPDGIRFFKYCHWLVNGNVNIFLPAGEKPIGIPGSGSAGYEVNSEYLKTVGVLRYENGNPVIEQSPVQQVLSDRSMTLSDRVLEVLELENPIELSAFGFSEGQWMILKIKLKNRIIISDDGLWVKLKED